MIDRRCQNRIQIPQNVWWFIWFFASKRYQSTSPKRSKVDCTPGVEVCLRVCFLERRTSPVVNSTERNLPSEKKETARKYCQDFILSSGITCKEGTADSWWLLSGGVWRLRSVFFLPAVARPAEARKHKELCFGSGHCSLLRNRQTEMGALKEGTDRLEGAKRGPGKDERQLFLQSLHLRLLGASLHPALPPSSSAAAQGLLQQRKTPLMAQTERSVCVLRTELLSL